MYGLKKDEAKEVFDLEKDLLGPDKADKASALKKLIASRQEELKKELREGEDKEAFATAEALLHGYNALQQVVERISTAKR